MPAESDRFGLHKKRPDAVRPHLDDVGSTVGAAIAMQFRTKERCERAQVTDLVAIRAPFTDQQSSRALPRGFLVAIPATANACRRQSIHWHPALGS